MKRLTVMTLAVVGIIGVTALATTVAASWADKQTSNGNVSVSLVAGSDFLYICEPAGPNPDPCPGDDSGPDEIIFETDEQLVPTNNPSNFKEWRIRLRNIDPVDPLDITGYGVTMLAETADPGNDCNTSLSFEFRTVTVDDDHPGGNIADIDGTSGYTIHIEPLGWDDVRIRTHIPSDFPVSCQGNAWDMNFEWTAEAVH